MNTRPRNIFLALALVSTFFSTPDVLAQAQYDLRQAAFSGDLQKLRAILKTGADVNTRDGSESTPLMLAVSKGHIAVVRELLAKGADIDLRNSYGWTPLMLAKANRHTEIADLLVPHSTDQKLANQQSGTSILAPKKAADTGSMQENYLRADIVQLLETAEHHMELFRLTKPAKDNAYTTFIRVLEYDQQNRQAKEGLQRIATFYEKRAHQYLVAGAVRPSLRTVKRGLKVVPNHRGLLAVRSKANAILEAIKTRRRLVVPAEKDLREKIAVLNEMEKKLGEEEQAMRQSIQNVLQRTFRHQEN